ncbi:nicotinate phosphoribosyltransferase [Cylindrospermopsis raciborskii]|uniref:nicotinate phosphoribosyltransferase n=1 Tax=Cylindrospermopsis raciborskii TaxID=77022 RepID=UPI001142247D|nr:nicotinate phosphoribosyltransferase [Cylindrospermopsis raciborskii]TPX28538.1 nicotinate phosphoribosyltransferase [Cylindrospermopsis raciborskii GIHE 2018]
MMISKSLARVVQFLSEAFMRIFSPTDDAYPMTGFQPFTGIPYKRHKFASW